MDRLYGNIAILTFLGIAAYYDAKENRIPNILTYTMIGTGMLYTYLQFVLQSRFRGMPFGMPFHEIIMNKAFVAKMAAILFIFAISSTVKLMGGGDTKLLMGLCMWTSPSVLIQVFLLAHLAVGLALIKRYIFAVKIQVRRLLYGEFKKEKYVSAGRIPMAPAFFMMYSAYAMCPVTKLISLF